MGRKGRFGPTSWLGCIALFLLSANGVLLPQGGAPSLGLFQNHADIGAVLRAGSAQYDSEHRTYTLTGGGGNMGSASDAFQFAWKQVSGDVTLTADVAFAEPDGNPYRQAVLMIRQSLDADSPFADVALNGEGLASLQYRDDKVATTREIESNLSSPHRLRIEKRGDFISVFLASAAGSSANSASRSNEPLHPSGLSIKLPLQGSFYVGIGVCSRNKEDKGGVAKAVFSEVELVTPAASAAAPILFSTLETVSIASGNRRVIYTAPSHFEAPNWSHDGAYFFFNSEGHILRLPVAGGTPTTIDTGTATHCNNDHGISPDSTQLAISDSSQADHQSSVYVVSIGGGMPRRVTQNSPSYWHGWSPDGKTLAFVGQRNGDFDIYTIRVAGGEETRLTTAEFNNWFPHISPDSKWMVFLSYGSDVVGHPPNKDVELRLMSLSSGGIHGKITVLAKLFGGQGTMNVPSWSPDSRKVAFVSYELLPSDEAEIK